MKGLLVVTAILEALIGLTLLLSPAFPVSLLLGISLDAHAGVVARVAAAALLSLGVACWMARVDAPGRVARGVVAAMLIYNVAVTAILAYAALGLGLSGMGLWPAVGLHVGLAGWCIACFVKASRPMPQR